MSSEIAITSACSVELFPEDETFVSALERQVDAFKGNILAQTVLDKKLCSSRVKKELTNDTVAFRVVNCMREIFPGKQIFPLNLCGKDSHVYFDKMMGMSYGNISNLRQVCEKLLEHKNHLGFVCLIEKGFNPFGINSRISIHWMERRFSHDEMMIVLGALAKQNIALPWKTIARSKTMYQDQTSWLFNLAKVQKPILFERNHLILAAQYDREDFFDEMIKMQVSWGDSGIPSEIISSPKWVEKFIDVCRAHPYKCDAYGENSVFVAARKNAIDVIRFFHSKGYDLMKRSGSQRTPLHMAFCLASKDVIEFYIFDLKLSPVKTYGVRGTPLSFLHVQHVKSIGAFSICTRYLEEVCEKEVLAIACQAVQMVKEMKSWGEEQNNDKERQQFLESTASLLLQTFDDPHKINEGAINLMDSLFQSVNGVNIDILKEKLKSYRAQLLIASQNSPAITFRERFCEQDFFHVIADLIQGNDNFDGSSVFANNSRQGHIRKCFGCDEKSFYSCGLQTGTDLDALGFDVELEDLLNQLDRALEKQEIEKRIHEIRPELPQGPLDVNGILQSLRASKLQIIKDYMAQNHTRTEQLFDDLGVSSIAELKSLLKCETSKLFDLVNLQHKRSRLEKKS